MKLKEYLTSLVTRRKSSTSSKSTKPKAHHESISSTDCHYNLCGYEDPTRHSTDDHHSRTEILLARHAQLINNIVGTRSQENSCSQCQINPQSELNRNYSNTLATSKPHRECQQPTHLTSSNNSLWTTTRQRTKIRTNPWIKTAQISQPEHPIPPSGIIHSESFPQTISNGNPTLHQSDSGHGFSLTSSRVIHSSSPSSPDNTSNDGILLDEKHKQCFPTKTIPSDNKRKVNKPNQSRYQRSKKVSTNSPRLHNDHFSMEFEEIVENERLHKQRTSPFILPLDERDVQLTSILYPTTLKKTNSRTILKHIEEIENEIRLIKNLNLDHDEQILSKDNDKQSIHQQVDQWVEQCLNKSPNTVHTKHDQLSNSIKTYVQSLWSNDTSSLPKSQKQSELMTVFYLSSIPKTKRTSSFIDQPSQLSDDFKPIHECPF
jgi:hypothetical protein